MVKGVSVFMPLLNYCHHFLAIYDAVFLVVLLIGVEMEREEAHMTSERGNLTVHPSAFPALSYWTPVAALRATTGSRLNRVFI